MKEIRNQVIKFCSSITMKALQTKGILTKNTGDGYVDTAVFS